LSREGGLASVAALAETKSEEGKPECWSSTVGMVVGVGSWQQKEGGDELGDR